MNDSVFWRHMQEREERAKRGFIDTPEEFEHDNERYRAWRKCAPGTCANFTLIPAITDSETVFSVPYLQPITIKQHRVSKQMAILCHSTSMIIFLEGEALDGLQRLLSERQIKSIHGYDFDIKPHWEEGEPYIEKITVEER